MSKRGADIQLTQDNYNDLSRSQDSDDQSGEFKFATKEVLQQRVIKKPKSRIGITSANQPISTQKTTTMVEQTKDSETQKPKLFGGFSFANPNAAEKKTQTTSSTAFGSSFQPKPIEDQPPKFNFGQAATAFGSNSNPLFQPKTDNSNQAQNTTIGSATTSLFGSKSLDNNTKTENVTVTTTPSFSFGSFKKPGSANDDKVIPESKPTTSASSISTSSLFNKPANTFGTQPASAPSLFGSAPPQPSGNISQNKNLSNTQNLTFGIISKQKSTSSSGNASGAPVPNIDDVKGYLKSMRGLNVSFAKSINEAIDNDPFADISPMFDQYKKFVDTLKLKYPQTGDLVSGDNTAISQPTMPSFNFEQKSKETGQKLQQKSLLFSAGASAVKESSDLPPKPNSIFSASVTNTAQPKSNFSSLNPNTDDSTASKPKLSLFQQPSNSIFDNQAPETTNPSREGGDKNQIQPAPKQSFTFGNGISKPPGNIFGNSFSSTQLISEASSKSNSSQDTILPTTQLAPFVIGSNVSTSFIASPAPSEKKKSEATKSFSFDGNKPSGFSIFNTNSTASANAFSFGKDDKSNQLVTNPIGSVSFGAAPNAPSSAPAPVAEDGEDADAVPASPSKLASSAKEKGEGEEDEMTIYDIKSKIFKFDNESKKYNDLGVGYLRVNTSEANNKKTARLLCRQDGSSIITLNAAIFKNMPLDQAANSKAVGVTVFDMESKPVRYMIRVKTIGLATELFNQIKTVRDSL